MSETGFSIGRTPDRVTPIATLQVEVIADFVCPFSFLGKRRLDEALTAVQGPVEVSWYPFQLNPEIPHEGLPFDDYLARRFGSREVIAPVLDELAAEGRRQGVRFDFDRIRHVPNTLAAHQLVQHAGSLGSNQTALAESLMSAFFEHGRNIGEREVLLELGELHGIAARETASAIGSDAARQVVLTREAQVRRSGLNAAPGFLMNRRLLVVGAQPTENLVNAFDRAMFGEGTDALVSPALH